MEYIISSVLQPLCCIQNKQLPFSYFCFVLSGICFRYNSQCQRDSVRSFIYIHRIIFVWILLCLSWVEDEQSRFVCVKFNIISIKDNVFELELFGPYLFQTYQHSQYYDVFVSDLNHMNTHQRFFNYSQNHFFRTFSPSAYNLCVCFSLKLLIGRTTNL